MTFAGACPLDRRLEGAADDMADVFTLAGSYSVEPASGSPSGDPEIATPLEEAVNIDEKSVVKMVLASDSPAAVAFGAITNAHIVFIRARGGKVRVRLTSADGSQQSVPADPLLLVISQTVPITAIDLTRLAGVETTVQVFLGEKPS